MTYNSNVCCWIKVVQRVYNPIIKVKVAYVKQLCTGRFYGDIQRTKVLIVSAALKRW